MSSGKTTIADGSSKTTILDEVYAQAYEETKLLKDLLPALQRELERLEQLSSKTQELPHRLHGRKYSIKHAISLISLSKDDIDLLDKESCHILLTSMKQLGPQLRIEISECSYSKQPWPSSRIHLKELSRITNPSKEVTMNEWYDHLYIELIYMKELYLPVLVDGHKRLDELISKGQVPGKKLEPLKCFLEKFMNLFTLRKNNIACADKKECRRLVQIAKLFVMGALIRRYAYQDVEQLWPLENLCAISELLQQMNMKASSDNECTRRDGGLEGDEAYHELPATRILSLKLDEAYNSAYRGCLCDMLASAFDEFLEKSLEFLATSRAGMISISKEKYYYRMMLINLFVVLTDKFVSANRNSIHAQDVGSQFQSHQVYPSETVSSNLVHHNQLESSPNCRDLIYEELRQVRKKYSSELDEAYRMMRGLCTQDPNLVKKRKVHDNIIFEDVLGLLGCTRADLALLSKEECLNQLMRIREYLNFPVKFVSAEQYAKFLESCGHSTWEKQRESLPYWRDEAYAEIRSKKTKFLHEFDGLCNEVHELMRQIPKLAPVLKVLRLSRTRPCHVFTLTRSEIALLTKEEYDNLAVAANGDLLRVSGLLTRLQPRIGGRTGFPCDFSRILLKPLKKAFENVAQGDECT